MNEAENIVSIHPRFNDEFFGFDKIEDLFLNLLNKKSISNAYLFNGVKGIGKATFAYRLARCLLKKKENTKLLDSLYTSKESNLFKSIANLSHPDINIIEANLEKKKISIENLKPLKKNIYVTSLESDYKVIIIDSLDDFAIQSKKQSFSSLLKLLEDCPSNCIFFLISHSLQNVPDTIKSRCQKIYFNPIPRATLRKWFENSKLVDKKNIDVLINLSNGSLGRALNIVNNNIFFDVYNCANEVIFNFKDISKTQINSLFSMYNKDLSIDDFLLVIQINIIEAIKKEIEEQKNVDKEVIEIFINLFFEINKKINNSKTFELDSVQIINTVEYIFIKKLEQLKKYKNG